MIKREKQLVIGLILVFLSLNLNFLGVSAINTGNQNVPQENKVDKISVATTTQDVNFTFNKQVQKNFNGTFNEGTINVSRTLDQLNNFTSYSTSVVSGTTVDEYLLTTTILNMTMINNHNIGGGSTSAYLNVNANNNISTLDNSGSYYSLSNGQSTDINIQVFSGWSDRASFSIDVEKSGSLSPYLGIVTVSQVFTTNQTGCYLTETGNAQLCVANNISGSKTVTLSNEQIANYYRPDLYLANETALLQSQTIFSPDFLYYRLLSGYDNEIGQNGLVIEYLYYWPNETDNFGAQLGHYYDFAPVFVYLRNFGDSPYRIVFETQNPSSTAHLPAFLEIYSETYTSHQQLAGTYDVSTDMTPILGFNMTTGYDEYPISTLYTSSNYANRSSEFPMIITPTMMALDTYHNMEFGNGSSQLTSVRFSTSLEPFNYSTILYYYTLLNQAFVSPLYDYSWNNYIVPTNLSLTLDMFYNPFTKPFFIDCFENVAHENTQARTNTQSTIFGSVLLNTTVIIPATITMSYPANMLPGSDNTANISIHMDENNVMVLFDYLVNLSTNLKLWYVSKNVSLYFNGGISVKIPLATISSLQRLTGMNGISDPHTFANYLTINSLYINAGLLGTLFNASVSINLYKILDDAVTAYQPELLPIFKVLNVFISAINLDITPSLQGLVVGDIASSNTAVATITSSSFILNAQDKQQTIGIHVPSSASLGSNFKLQITNYMYAMNFTNTWAIGIEPSKILGYLVNGIEITLGVYPNIQSTVEGGSSGAKDANTNTIQSQDIQIGKAPQSTASSTKQTSGSTPGFTLISLLIPLAVICLYLRKRRKEQ